LVVALEMNEITDMLQQVANDRGVPRSIRTVIEDSIGLLSTDAPKEERLSQIISLLDEASADPNISMSARTNIWGLVSVLENECKK
jgi:uncharacterized protein (UPF0147 family)